MSLAIELLSVERTFPQILETPPLALEITANRGTQKSDFAFGREAFPEENTSLAFEPVGVEGVPLWILEAPPLTRENTADRGTQKSHLALG